MFVAALRIHTKDYPLRIKIRNFNFFNRLLTYDIQALEWADTCVMVLPCGRSAHTEAGWLAGKGKRTVVYIPEMQEAELMYLLFDLVTDNLEEVVSFLK